MSFYRYLPEYINPILISIGSFNIRWYSIMYLVGFGVVYLLLTIRNKKALFPNSYIVDFLLHAFIGLVVGARVGYVLLYDPSYFLHHPIAIISPFDAQGNFIGLFGMSYFGGLIGIIIASLIFTKKKKIDFWRWADFVIPAVPAGYFFGRIGNFLNGELYGNPTGSLLGMYFSADSLGVLRHPTPLYEAFFEGAVLFIVLWALRDKSKFPGYLLALYLFGYGSARFFIEFLREPEMSVAGLTTGQLLSGAAIVGSLLIFFLKNKEKTFSPE